MPFLDDVQRLFGTRDLYEVLETQRNANDKTIRRSYYRLALRFHPDRSAEDETTEKFQALSRINEILSDPETRRVYDDTGEVDDDSVPSDRDWTEYWRLLYRKVSEEDVKEFYEEYKGSEEEMEDLKAGYIASEGDMDKIMEMVLCASVLDDEDRFRAILDEWIEKGDVPKYKAYVRETKAKREHRHKKAAKEAEEAKKLLADMGSNDMDSDLSKAIKKRGKERQQEMESFFDQLERRYAGGGGKGKQKEGKKGKIVTSTVTLRKRKANLETGDSSKNQASKKRKQSPSSQGKPLTSKRARKMDDIEDSDESNDDDERTVKNGSNSFDPMPVTKKTDEKPSTDTDQDTDTDDGVIVTRRKLRQRTAAKKRGGKEKPIKEEDKKEEPVRKGDRREEPVEIDSEEEVDRKQKRQSPKRILRKPKEDGKNKKQMKAAGNGRKRVKEPDTAEPYLMLKASLRLSKVKIGKIMKPDDDSDLDSFSETTEALVESETVKSKFAIKTALKTEEACKIIDLLE